MDAVNELTNLAPLLQGGSSVAILIFVWFLRDISQRMSRVEKMLEIALILQGKPVPESKQ